MCTVQIAHLLSKDFFVKICFVIHKRHTDDAKSVTDLFFYMHDVNNCKLIDLNGVKLYYEVSIFLMQQKKGI